MKRIQFLTLLIALLTACTTGETPSPTLTSPASPVPTLAPTPTSPASPVPTPTPTLSPTATAPPPSPTPLPPPPTLERTGQTGGASRAVAVQGDYAYFNVGPRLLILDVSDPTQPTLAGQSHPLPGFEGLAVAGNHAYVAAGKGGLRVMDISNPATPTEVGSYETPDPAWNVTILENTAYLAAGDGLHILDLSDPAAPLRVGFYPTPDALLDVAVVENTAYLAEAYSEDEKPLERGGLRVVDISDPAQPDEIGYYPMNPDQADEFQRPHAPRGIRAVAVVQDYAYLTYRTERRGGLRVVDISDPAHPREVGDYQDYVYYVSDVAVVHSPLESGQTYAYVATGVNFGLLILDLSDPAQPVIVTDEVSGAAQGIARAENTLYVADEYGGLHVADISDPAHALEIGFYDTLGDARQIVVSGDTAYVADGLRELRAMDLSDPASPVEISSYVAPGSIQAIAVASSTVFIAAETAGLQVVDFADPARPVQVGSHTTPGLAYGVAVAGNYVYVAAGQLYATSISGQTGPTEVYERAEPIRKVTIARDLAYLPSSGFQVLDLSNPTQPVEIGFYDAPGMIWDLAIAADHAYAIMAGGLNVVNVSDPSQPVEVGFYKTPEDARRVAVAESPVGSGQVYVCVVAQGHLYVLDVSDPSAPKETLSYAELQSANDVAVAGNYIYVADGLGGLVTFRLDPSVISLALSDD